MVFWNDFILISFNWVYPTAFIETQDEVNGMTFTANDWDELNEIKQILFKEFNQNTTWEDVKKILNV